MANTNLQNIGAAELIGKTVRIDFRTHAVVRRVTQCTNSAIWTDAGHRYPLNLLQQSRHPNSDFDLLEST